MIQKSILQKASLKVYLEKLKSSDDSGFTKQAIRQVEVMIERLDYEENNPNQFLEDYSLSDLKVLIADCYEVYEGCLNEKGEIEDKEGELVNNRLNILNDIFNNKVEEIYKQIKV